jgi:hypothetical protein
MSSETDQYQLVSQPIGSGLEVIVIKRKNATATFLDEIAQDSRREHEAALITRATVRLLLNGADWGMASQTLKLLKGRTDVALYELRVKATVYRVMVYLHNDLVRTPVLLCAFKGHRSTKGGGIREQDMQRGLELAKIARNLMEQEGKA